MTNYMVKKSSVKLQLNSQCKLDFSQNNAYDLSTLFNLKEVIIISLQNNNQN